MQQDEQTPPQSNPGQGFYKPSAPQAYEAHDDAHQPVPARPSAEVHWEASEYIQQDRGTGWIIGVVVVTTLLAGGAVWAGVWTFALLLVIMAGSLLFLAFRPPRVLQYSVSDAGIQIDQVLHQYNEFRSFGVVEEGAFFNLRLIPIKRFATDTNLYFAQEEAEKIVAIIGSHLPLQDMQPDLIDQITRRLRF